MPGDKPCGKIKNTPSKLLWQLTKFNGQYTPQFVQVEYLSHMLLLSLALLDTFTIGLDTIMLWWFITMAQVIGLCMDSQCLQPQTLYDNTNLSSRNVGYVYK